MEAAIESQDWESATRHCGRAMAVPQDVIAGPFAESTVVCSSSIHNYPSIYVHVLSQPTAESPLPPSQTLSEARQLLLTKFRREFARASELRDSAATSRYFKLFPAIGWEKEGLEAYSDFVIDLVRGRAPAAGKSESG